VPQIYLLAWCILSAGPAGEDDPIEAAMRATARVVAGQTSGTAFFVSTASPTEAGKQVTLLITAAHVFEGMPGDIAVAVLRSKVKDGYVRKETPFAIRKGGKPLWTRHKEMDVAVLPFSLPAGTDIQPLDFARVAEAKWAEEKKVRAGDDVYVPCYPVKAEGNPVGWAILRKGSIATHPLTPVASAKTIFIDYSHFNGDSGSPVVVIRDKKPLVVGLVIAMLRQTDRSVSMFEERTVHTPLGLALTVQSPLIREAVEAWKGKK
jgi:hypothetical protein